MTERWAKHSLRIDPEEDFDQSREPAASADDLDGDDSGDGTIDMTGGRPRWELELRRHRTPSIWKRGISMHPELDMNFAEKATIAHLLKRVYRRAAGRCTVAMSGDGAPNLKMGMFVRAALAHLRGGGAGAIEAAMASAAAEVDDGEDEEEGGDDDKKSIPTDVYAAVLNIYNILGAFHAFLDIEKRTFTVARTTLAALAPLWRGTFPKVRFFLDCGNAMRCYKEAMSCVAGITRCMLDQFRASDEFKEGQVSLDQFEEWMEDWARGAEGNPDREARFRARKYPLAPAPIIRDLLNTIDQLLLAKMMRDAMCSASAEAFLLTFRQCLEIAGATGGDQYVRILADFLVLVATMPDKVLVHLTELMFTDYGSHYKPQDEATEDFHRMLKLLVGSCPNPQTSIAQLRRYNCTQSAFTRLIRT